MNMTQTQTPRQFRTTAEKKFRKANPDAVAVGVAIEWQFTGPLHTDHFGHKVRFGHFKAIAPGFRPSTISAWSDLTTGQFTVA